MSVSGMKTGKSLMLVECSRGLGVDFYDSKKQLVVDLMNSGAFPESRGTANCLMSLLAVKNELEAIIERVRREAEREHEEEILDVAKESEINGCN